jgi:hypothetical protein
MTEMELLDLITSCRHGSVIAPAGCGKTEQIARAVLHSKGRRLILTHTLAGVDVLRVRLKDKGTDPEHCQISTIASWSLRIASAFPLRSGLSLTMPASNKEWDTVYASAVKLLRSKSIDGIIRASYSGVFVDEYQDCTRVQHQLICALADLLPCCIFGDPLQAIFGFRGNPLPDWDQEVLVAFPKIAKLSQPHRWEKVGNRLLGAWLLKCRDDLKEKGQIDLRCSPSSVNHCMLVGDTKEKLYQERIKLVLKALEKPKEEKCIIIGDSQNEAKRALLARNAKASAVEPITCKRLVKFVKELEGSRGEARLNIVLDLVKDIMSGADVASLKKVVNAVAAERRRKPLDISQTACVEITRSEDLRPILHLLEEIRKQREIWIYRRELYSALCAALRVIISGTHTSLADAVWDVQNRRRHTGRCFAKRSIGSTLLVKGLEFDHAIIVDVESFKRNDLYVALTRASRSVTVISESCLLNPVSC